MVSAFLYILYITNHFQHFMPLLPINQEMLHLYYKSLMITMVILKNLGHCVSFIAPVCYKDLGHLYKNASEFSILLDS